MTFLNFSQTEWQQIAISAGIVIAALILTRPLLNFMLDKIVGRITGATQTTLDDMLIKAIRPPLFWLVIVIVLDLSLRRLTFLNGNFRDQTGIISYLIYSALAVIIVWRLVDAGADWYTTEVTKKTDTPLDNQMVPFVRRLARILLIGIAAIMILGHFEIEVSGLLATLGIGSLAIALAAQAALSDTISGFMIMLDRPFRIGDRIEIMELNTWGDVEDIGLRSTRIRTRDNRMVVVPNSVISKSLVVNYAYPNSEYRIQINIGVAFGTDIEYARKTIVETVSAVDGVDTSHPVEALFLEFGDSALIFRVRWWLNSYADTRRMFDKVNTAMYNALNEAGIEIPFPQQDLNIKMDSEDGEIRFTLPGV